VDARVAGPAGWGRRRLSGIAVVESDDVEALGSQQHAEVLVPPVHGPGGTGEEEDRRSARVTELVDRQADAVEAEELHAHDDASPTTVWHWYVSAHVTVLSMDCTRVVQLGMCSLNSSRVVMIFCR